MRIHIFVFVAILAASPSLHAQARQPPVQPPAIATAVPKPLPSITLPAALDRVLRDYERYWKASDAAELANLFTEDGLVMQNGRMPVRGRASIRAAYAGVAGGDLRLRAFAYAMSDTVGFIQGGYTYRDADDDIGKFTLTLRRARGGRWLIASDMDNANAPRSSPP